jgi:hypothetical protein
MWCARDIAHSTVARIIAPQCDDRALEPQAIDDLFYLGHHPLSSDATIHP